MKSKRYLVLLVVVVAVGVAGEQMRVKAENQQEKSKLAVVWTSRQGDSFYIKAGFKHRLVNLGKRAIKQITVMDPPRY